MTSAPWSRTRPAVGSSKPAIIRSVVVLPEPDGPSIEKNSPSRDVEVDPVDRDDDVAVALDARRLEPDGGTPRACGTGSQRQAVGVGIAKRDLEVLDRRPGVTAGRVRRTVPRGACACQGRGAVVPTGAS